MDWLSAIFGNQQTPPFNPAYTEEEQVMLTGGTTQPGNPNARQGGLWVDQSTDYEKPEELPWYFGLFGGDEDDGQGGFAAHRQQAQGGRGVQLPNMAVPQQQRQRRQQTAVVLPAYLRSLMGE